MRKSIPILSPKAVFGKTRIIPAGIGPRWPIFQDSQTAWYTASVWLTIRESEKR